jgi:acetolactate synthase-1/3 small subunit
MTENPNVSRMTIVVTGDEHTVAQICKQLYKLIEVIEVTTLKEEESVARELALIKIACEPRMRSQVTQITGIFRAKIVDVGRDTMTVEVTGDEQKVDAFLQLASDFGIKEIARTGRIALARGSEHMICPKEEVAYGHDFLRCRQQTGAS